MLAKRTYLLRLFRAGRYLFVVGSLLWIGCNSRRNESVQPAERALSSAAEISNDKRSGSIELQAELLGQAIDSNNLQELDRLLEGTISQNEKAMELAVVRSLDRRSMPSFRLLMAKMPIPDAELPNSLAMKKAVREGNIEAALKLWEAKRRCDLSQLIQLLEDDRLFFDSDRTGEQMRLLELVQNEMDDDRRLRFLKKIFSSHQFRLSFREWLDWVSTQSKELQRAVANEVVDKFISGLLPPPNCTLRLSDFRQADDSAKLRLLSSMCFSEERRQRTSGDINDLGLENLDLSDLTNAERIREWPELSKIASKSRINSLENWIRDVEMLVKRNGTTADFSKIWDGNCKQFLDSSLSGDIATNTALTLALENDRLDFAQWLFQRGARLYSKDVRSVISRVFLYIEKDEPISETALATWPERRGVWSPDSISIVPYEPLVHAVHKGSSKKLSRLIKALESYRGSHEALVDSAFDTASRLNLPELEQVILPNSPWNMRRNVKIFREHFGEFCQIVENNSSFQKQWMRNLPQFLGEFMSPPEPNHLSNAFELYWKIFDGIKKGKMDQEIDFLQSYDIYLQIIAQATLLRMSTSNELQHLESQFEDAMSKAVLDPNVLELSLIEGMPLTDKLIRKIVSDKNARALRVLLKNASLRKKHAFVLQNCFEESSTKEDNELVDVFLSFGLRHAK